MAISLKNLFININLNNNNTNINDDINKDLSYCSSCKSENTIISDRGNLVCINCGSCKSSDISDDPECQYSGLSVGDNSVTCRTGIANNDLLPHSNYSTKLVGNKINPFLKTMNNVWQNQSHKNKEKILKVQFKFISDFCKNNNLPNNIIDIAQTLFWKVREEQTKSPNHKSCRGENLDGIKIACIYHACRKYGINRSYEELAEMAGINVSYISFGSKLISNILNGTEMALNGNSTTYQHFIYRYSSSLNLTDDDIRLILDICANINNYGLLKTSKPDTIMAVTIYFTSVLYDLCISKNDIVHFCDISDCTLDKHFKDILQYADKIII